MCRRTSCGKCGKVTWAGCGAHVDAVMAGVREADRCKCGQGKKRDATPAQPSSSSGNVSQVDRAVRLVAGAGVVSLAMVGPQTPWAWLGLIPLVTGLVGFCPLYRLLGISTAGAKTGSV